MDFSIIYIYIKIATFGIIITRSFVRGDKNCTSHMGLRGPHKLEEEDGGCTVHSSLVLLLLHNFNIL